MTLPIDLQFRGVGRLHVRSGTTKKATRNTMRDMLRNLYEMGRADILRDIKANKVRVLDVYERYRTGRLDQLPSGDLMGGLRVKWVTWLDAKELDRRTRRDYEQAIDRVMAHVTTGATLGELPAALKAHRKACRGARPRTFNKDRAAALSFLSGLVGDRHWLYAECVREETLKIPESSKMAVNPQTVSEIRELGTKLPAHHALTLWAYFLTGMRPEEMFQEDECRWTLEADRVRVMGTKTSASVRVVPRVGLLVKPSLKRRSFAKALSKASGKTVTPYDLRRSYAQLLDLARIPQFRQDYYMAHGPKDLNTLYKRAKECEQYLAEDATAIENLIRVPTNVPTV